MFPFPSLGLIAAAVLAAFCGGFITGCQNEKERFDAYKATVKAVGEAQEARTRERIALDKQRKEKADEENKRARNRLAATVRELRESRTSVGLVPPSAPGSLRPHRACYDRGELNAALSGFVEGVAGLVEQGESCRLAIDGLRRWAQQVGAP